VEETVAHQLPLSLACHRSGGTADPAAFPAPIGLMIHPGRKLINLLAAYIVLPLSTSIHISSPILKDFQETLPLSSVSHGG
jgi:hypothetical protein